MPDSTHSKRSARLPRARLCVIATLASGIVVAACGGGSHSPSTASEAHATTSKASAASLHSHRPSTGGSGALAFSKCMRANGVPDFPDPGPGRVFSVPPGVNPAAPAFRAAQAKCEKLLGGGPPAFGSTTHPSPQTLAKLDRIARCMRQHGVPQFPDPRTSIPSNPTGMQEITDFDGAVLLFPTTINLEAPAYRKALNTCGAPPLGLPH